MTKDRRLGRGLAALLGSPLDEHSVVDGSFDHVGRGDSSTATAHPPATRRTNSAPPIRQSVTGSVPLSPPVDSMASAASEPEKGQTLQLNVHEIEANPFQPRRQFNEEEIASLAASFQEHEQLQPILVRRVGDRYQLISGERRLRAAIHAGLQTIRAELREADDRLVAELAIVENLQRKDLDPIEKALSFRRYITEHQCSQEDLAKRLKIDRSTIANMMRLLESPAPIQEWVQSGELTAGHAKTILALGDEDLQMDYARRAQQENWSVRETERQVALVLSSDNAPKEAAERTFSRSKRTRISPHIAQLEQQFRLSLGTKTDIRQNTNGGGKITIAFKNNEEFERLCSLICPQANLQRAA